MSALLKKMREQRMFWIDVDDTHKLQILPPTELQVVLASGAVVDPQNFAALVQDWKGYSEADFLGAGVASSDPIALDREALNEWFALHTDMLANCLKAINDEFEARREKRQESEKN
jgi:hypothetical protein